MSIQVVQPALAEGVSLEDHGRTLALFWTAVDADPRVVVVVAHGNPPQLEGVFSTITRAMRHAESLGGDAVLASMHIDEPGWRKAVIQ